MEDYKYIPIILGVCPLSLMCAKQYSSKASGTGQGLDQPLKFMKERNAMNTLS